MQLNGKRLIVTGTAGGIGASVLRGLVRAGAQVAAMDVSDAAGVMGLLGCAHYSAAKPAMLDRTRTVAREWPRHGISVNAATPGMWTPMYEAHRARMDAPALAAHDAMMSGLIPLGGRLGHPDRDITPFVVFMMSDGACFITGQALAVDGGLMIP